MDDVPLTSRRNYQFYSQVQLSKNRWHGCRVGGTDKRDEYNGTMDNEVN